MNEALIIPLIIAVIIGLLLFLLLIRRWHNNNESADHAPRFDEKAVEDLLKKSGYKILGKYVKESIITNIEGKDHFNYLEADYLVEQLKDKYVVVVKTGEGPTDANEATMRRRLLEFHRVFRSKGIILLDPHDAELHRVTFRFPHERNLDFFFNFLVGVFIVATVVGIIWMLVTLKLF